MSSRTTTSSPSANSPSIRFEVPYSLAAFLTTTKGLSLRRLVAATRGTAPSATSLLSERPYVVVRKAAKEYGTSNRIEGELAEGEEVVVLEDIATTGQSALDAVEALREAGARVSRVLVVVDREEGARETLAEHDIELEALLTASALLDAD